VSAISRRIPVAACAAVALLSVWNTALVWRQSGELIAAGDRWGVAARHARFAALTTRLGVVKKLDFITNQADRGRLYFSAAYELAPRFLLLDPIGSEFVVGSFEEPVNIEATANANGLRIVEDFGGGVVLFRRKPA